ncbi:MAG TPA: citrate/2-methylcitrate synthase [Terriglobia bacterium]|nr:citrate/2-methylcitrate synthase [Terriglobia bacterium]
MPQRLPSFLSELPSAPEYSPVTDAIARTSDSEIAAALRLFASMPPSTGVLANPVRHRLPITCNGDAQELNIRSFGVRGCLLEEDIVTGSVDAARVIFVGLFGRFANTRERRSFQLLLSQEFSQGIKRVLPALAKFMKAFPNAPADTSMQYMSSIRKATKDLEAVNASRSSASLLRDLIRVHLENAAVGACSSYMRALLGRRPSTSAGALVRQTERFLESTRGDPFRAIFSLLLRRKVNPIEAGILQNLGTIQIHHGSAGSNMVARYFASLHAKSTSDLFTAAQMALDCARHFGAITDLTELVGQLEHASPGRRDELIRQRAAGGNLPAFGHPEIAAAGRAGCIELDPRPAIYLSPLFEAIDAGSVEVSETRMKRVEIVQRMYQLAFVEGIEKPGRRGRLRIAPNTDFGTWIVQEVLGIEEVDRTLLSYVFRGFGWMMDVREQLQQPIIRPVIPPDPGIVPPPVTEGVIPGIVSTVHNRLCGTNAFLGKMES